MKEMTVVDKATYSLVVLGGLNWGLVGFFKYNLVDKVFGVGSTGARVVYAVVGLAAVYCLVGIVKMMSEQSK